MEQAVLVHQPESAAGLGLGKSVLHQGRAQVIGDADCGRPGAEEYDLLVAESLAGDADGAQDRAQRDGRRPLDVVVERQQLVAIAVEDRSRMRRREVLPLQADVGQLLLDGLDELVDKVEVGLPGDPLVAPADVLGVVQSLGVVGSDVEHDGQGPFGANAADERVKRELADRNAEAAGPLVADAQDPLAVGDDDHIHFVMGAIAQERRDCVTQRVRDERPRGRR